MGEGPRQRGSTLTDLVAISLEPRMNADLRCSAACLFYGPISHAEALPSKVTNQCWIGSPGPSSFSSYGLQTFMMLRDGEIGLATLNVAVSNVLGLLMVWMVYVAQSVVRKTAHPFPATKST